jgi:two-component system response regulator AtoC
MTTTTRIPSPPPVHILVAEDEPEIRDYLQVALRRPNFVIDFAEDGEEVLNVLAEGVDMPSLFILDVVMPRKDGISTLREIRRQDPTVPIIMVSGLSTAANIVDAMKGGASNFLTKPISHEELHQAIDQLLPRPSLVPKPAPIQTTSDGATLSAGNWRRRIDPLLERIAASDVPVLLQGETGSGKEVLARRIHDQSRRSREVFLKLNCAALPSELVESELFGYERGAFTGAFKSNPGKFELANGGTIFLDEIGDMDFKLQAKLLQVLQDHEFLRLGAKEPTRVDVRVIAATHRDLETRIAESAFREDLYYRLNVANILIPPLRDRRDEIVPLASLFLRKHNNPDSSGPVIGPELRAALLDYHWPGNIRELENVMRRYVVLREAEIIIEELRAKAKRESQLWRQVAVFKPRPEVQEAEPPSFILDSTPSSENGVPANLQAGAPIQGSEGSGLAKVNEDRKRAETEVIIQALNSTLWNRKRAAALLGTDYKALLYKMKKLGIG